MTDGTALSQGDGNRNDRLARLRVLLPGRNVIVGIDLADDKQAAVVTDHNLRVLARPRVMCWVWELGSLRNRHLIFRARHVLITRYGDRSSFNRLR